MKTRWLSLTFYSLLLINAPAYSQTNKDLIGTWHNELKATINIIAIAPDGQLTGTYVSQPGKVFPIFGWVNPASKEVHVVPVIFRVKGGVYGTITVWAGYLSKGKDGTLSITTIWNVVRAYADPDSSPEVDNNESIFKPGPAN
jgi:hypothetical protein